jgi:hypothetical protein
MLDRTVTFFSLTSLAFVLSLLFCLPAKAALEPAGHVLLTNGPFIAIQTNASARSLSRGSEFYQGDRLWTGPRTRAQVRFSDGAIMTLRPDTEFSVDEYQFDDKNAANNTSFFTLIKGGFRTLTGLISKLRPDGYKVKTAYAIVGVRGTTYEIVDQSALYVAAWEGTISVTNNKSEMLLGFGQDFNYATVTSINSAPTGTVEVPPPLQQTPDPGLQQAMVDPTEVRLATAVDPVASILPPALSAAELASLTQAGFAAVEGTGSVINSPFGGLANDLAGGGNPIIFDDKNQVVLRQGTAPLVNVTTDTSTFPGFPVSWGEWNATTTNPAIVQPDFLNGTVTQDVTDTTFWITAVPTPTGAMPTGTFTYSNVLAFQGAGQAGPVNALNMNLNGTLNLGTGAVAGTMSVQNGPRAPLGFFDQWNVSLNGSFSSGQLNTSVTGGTVSIDGAIQSTAPSGNVNGVLTGPNGEAIAGAFDMQHSASGNYVQGTFLVRQ